MEYKICKTERRIKELYDTGITNPYEIAEILGYKPSSVQSSLVRIIKRSRPKHNYKKTKLAPESKAKIESIIKELQDGIAPIIVAKNHKCSRQYVHIIKNKYMENGEWKEV